MNTDVILDFIVEYYLWFIIGGAILLLALIGFVADKKKLFQKKKETKKIEEEFDKTDNNSKEFDIESIERNDSKLETVLNKTVSEDIDNGESVDMDNKESFTNNDERLSDEYQASDKDELSIFNTNVVDNEFIDVNNDVNAIDNLNTENEINDSINKNDSESDNFLNDQTINLGEPLVIDDTKDELKYIDELEIDNQTHIDNEKVEEKDSNGDVSLKNNTSDNVQIIDFNDDENNSFSKPLTDNELIDLNDKEDDNLNISYSKLKEMVEDILYEQENENDVQKNVSLNNQNLDVSNDIKPIIEPNLNQNAVEKIKQLDDEEDDVWKF